MSSLLSQHDVTISQQEQGLQTVRLNDIAGTFFTLVRRDLLVAGKRFPAMLVLLLLQPAFLLFALGRIQMLTGGIPPSYVSILMPGVLGVVVLAVSVQGVSSPLIIEFSYSKEIEDRLLSPIPVWLVGCEKILMGIMQTLVGALLYFPLAWLILGESLFHPVMDNLGLFVLALLLSSLAMSALGVLMGSILSGQGASVIFSILVVPMSFLGCVYFSWPALGNLPVLKYLVLFDPQTYMSEMFRGTLTHLTHLGLLYAFGGMLFWAILFTYLGLRAFQRKAVG